MAIIIINKDSERTWVVCHICGGAYDVRNNGSCKCGNVRSVPADKRGTRMTIADDSDSVEYDNSK